MLKHSAPPQGTMSVQLSVRGRPTAFDLSPSNDMAVVASPGCMTFFHLNGLGAPRHVIHYEQPQQIRRVKYQKEGKLSALRGGAVALWDPLHSLRPLLGIIRSSGWITDMDWSSGNANAMATSCDCGDVRIFDIRATASALQSMSLGGVCSNVAWCPSQPNLLAACNEEAAYVWDTRMLVLPLTKEPHNGCDGEIGSISICHMKPANGVHQIAWTHHDSPCLVTSCGQGSLSWWDGRTGSREAVREDHKAVGLDSFILPTPIGRAVVSTHKEANAQKPSTPDSTRSDSDATPIGESLQKVRRILTAIDATENDGVPPTSIWINGYPRKGYSLMNLYEPPGQQSTSSSSQYTAPSQQVALSPDPVLGMRWGTPGRLLPTHTGLELVMLSATSTLHAVALSHDVVDKFCGDGSGSTTSRAGRQQVQRISNKDTKTSLRMNPPRFSVSGLKRTLLSPSLLSGGEPADDSSHQSKGDFWGQLQHEILVLEEALQKGSLHGLSIGRIDQYAGQITLEMTRPDLHIANNASIPVVNASVSQETSQDPVAVGGSLSKAESYTSEPELAKASEAEDADKVQVAILIVSFPPKFPSRGQPSFTVRSLYDNKLNSTASTLESELATVAKDSLRNDKYPSLISTQLENNRSNMSSGFLLDVARCFCNRALQVWGAPPESATPSRSIVSTLTPTAHDGAEESVEDPKPEDGEENSEGMKKEDDEDQAHTVIDPLAYRVPCPISSGGIFSTTGILSCFGGSRLCFEVVTSSKPHKHVMMSDNTVRGAMTTERRDEESPLDGADGAIAYPKTYADLLLRIRESKQLELRGKRMGDLDGPGGAGGIENARLGRGMNSGPYFEHFFQYRRDDLSSASDGVDETSSDYGDDSESKSLPDEDQQVLSQENKGNNLHKARAGSVTSIGTHTSGQQSTSAVSDVRMLALSPTIPLSVSSGVQPHPFVEDLMRNPLDELGEELDRSQEFGGYKASEIRASFGMSSSAPGSSGGVHGPLNFRSQTKPIHAYMPTASKSAQVTLYTIYGAKRQILAKMYSFSAYPYNREMNCSNGNLSQYATGGGSDSNLQRLGLEVSLGPRSGSMNNLSQATGLLSQMKLEAPTLSRDDSDVLSRKFLRGSKSFGENEATLHHTRPFQEYKTSRSDLYPALSDSFPSHVPMPLGTALHGNTREHVNTPRTMGMMNFNIRSGTDIALTCRFNASLASRLKEDALSHMWHLLAVCFDIMVTTGYLDDTVLNDKMESCRRMVMCGMWRDWTVHALGRPLLRRIYRHLANVGDLQSTATITCTLGGAKSAAHLLDDPSLHTALSLDRILLRYADILHRWQCHVQATEVSKYVSRAVSNAVHIGMDGVSNSYVVSVKLGVRCATCNKEILGPWTLNGGTVNGPWCTSCRTFALRCSLCEQVLRGFGYFCPLCGHGGHPEHIKAWFESNDECPTGCGCRCASLGLPSLSHDNAHADGMRKSTLMRHTHSSRENSSDSEDGTDISSVDDSDDVDDDDFDDRYYD